MLCPFVSFNQYTHTFIQIFFRVDHDYPALRLRKESSRDFHERLLHDYHYPYAQRQPSFNQESLVISIIQRPSQFLTTNLNLPPAAMVNLLDLLHQKLELFRLEQRYTRRRNRRSTFVSEAQYVDGEYIYSPTSTYSAKCSAGSSDSEAESPTSDKGSGSMSKSSKRLSKMGLDKMDWRKGREDKRQSRLSVREVKWDGGVRA